MRPPDWLAYITAVLERDGHEVRLHDFPAREWERDQFIRLIRKQRPQAVILDSTTPSIDSDLNYASLVKQEVGAIVAMVGPHVTALPSETLLHSKGDVDYIIRGEPEYTARELFAALEQKSSPHSIRGLSYLNQGQPVNNQARPLIENLDELPYPAWHHLDLKKYFDGIKLYPFIDIIGGRGCPYQCSFCLWPQVMHGNQYRLRSPQNIVSEIKYDLRLWPWIRKGEFFFEDDTFTVNRDRALEICHEILKLKKKITWSVNARADHGDDELFQLMKKAGCRMLLIGYESGNDTVLKMVGKKLSPYTALQKAKRAQAAGLKIHGCFVLGLPGETEKSMTETIEYALELPLDTVQFSAAVPFPGTSYFEYCQKNGLVQAKKWTDWLANGEQSGVVDYPGLPSAYITATVDQALKQFYFRPRYMTRFLLSTRSLRDLYRKTRGALNFLDYLMKKMKS
ncbi:radical SAM protein [candidate division CSSED10-310 bacterium]|uniref:Radical SAM protein n=1 Tax=candidate division CSSED10-310 bacterium TaxID=2855610 RepID=A0ABV6YZI8_UNCC1